MGEGRIYSTQNTDYLVEGVDDKGREIIRPTKGLTEGMPYVIVGFADSEKVECGVYSGNLYWSDAKTHESLDRQSPGGLLARLDSEPRVGLRIVAWLTDRETGLVGPASNLPDELVSSAIKAIKD